MSGPHGLPPGREEDREAPVASAPAIRAAALPFATWTLAHALVMGAAGGAALALGRAWPVSLVAPVSFGALFWCARGQLTPRGGLGLSNGITIVRLVIAWSLGLVGADVRGVRIAAALIACWLLDGVDGRVARRLGLASVFGAAFDMETDALLALVASLQLWQRGRLGAWILIAGLLRYAYVVTLAIAPPGAGHAPRFRFARLAFGALLVGLIAAFARADALGTALAALGTACVVASFARSFLWSYGRRR